MRVDTGGKLSAVASVMRGIATAGAREALERLPGIRACADVIAAAIADAMTLTEPGYVEPAPALPAGEYIVVAIGAEQGLSARSNRIMEAHEAPLDPGQRRLRMR